jgi:hypothetical protein
MAEIVLDTNRLGFSKQCLELDGNEYIEYTFNLPSDFSTIEFCWFTSSAGGYMTNSNPKTHVVGSDFKKIALMGIKSGNGFVGENGNQFLGVTNCSSSSFTGGQAGYCTGGSSPYKPVAFNDTNNRTFKTYYLHVDENGTPNFSSDAAGALYIGDIQDDNGCRPNSMIFNRVGNIISVHRTTQSEGDPNTATILDGLGSVKANAQMTRRVNPTSVYYDKRDTSTFTVNDATLFNKVFLYIPEVLGEAFALKTKVHHFVVNVY